MKKNSNTRTIAFTAVWTALVYAFTLIAIPNGVGGYVNFGDSIILVCASLINPLCAAFAASVGATLADLTLGYAIWAPATLIIKFVMGLVCGIIIKCFRKFSPQSTTPNKALWIVGNGTAFVITELIMVISYFFASYLLEGGSWSLAATQFVSNFIQMAIGISIAFVLLFVARLDKVYYTIFYRGKSFNKPNTTNENSSSTMENDLIVEDNLENIIINNEEIDPNNII